MKLKMIAAVLAVGLSAQAHALDAGAGGNGELFLNVWDASGSYTRDLNITINAFNDAVAAGGFVNLSWSADATFSSFLAGVADVSALKWNVLASDSQGAVRNLVTFNAPSTSTLVQNTVNRGTIVTSIKGLATAYNNATGQGAVDSAVFTSTDAAYAGKSAFGSTLNSGLKQSNSGSMSDVLEFMSINSPATGTGNATYSQYFDNGQAVTMFFDGTTFQIAAVPEPEAYAMFLAGLGMIGAIARRRRNLV